MRGPSEQEIREKNRQVYDEATDRRWTLTVYRALHGGWAFSSLGGRDVLDYVGAHAGLHAGSHVLEACSGLGAACRYLAATFGCRATGIERNARQIARARAAARGMPWRVDFVHADITTWRPASRYDAAFTLDALMLVADRAGAVRTIREALRPAGAFVAAEVLAGPHITVSARDFMWREDGIVALPTPESQALLLEGAGFRVREIADLTPVAVSRNARIITETLRHEALLVDTVGPEAFRTWLRDARAYQRLFEDRALVYVRTAARRSTARRGRARGLAIPGEPSRS